MVDLKLSSIFCLPAESLTSATSILSASLKQVDRALMSFSGCGSSMGLWAQLMSKLFLSCSTCIAILIKYNTINQYILYNIIRLQHPFPFLAFMFGANCKIQSPLYAYLPISLVLTIISHSIIFIASMMYSHQSDFHPIHKASSKRTDRFEHSLRNHQKDRSKRQIQEHFHLTHLIGYDRLLSTLDKSSPLVQKWGEVKSCPVINDRFIPNRKLALNNYQRKENEDQEENEGEIDPQNVSITEIFCEEILGGKNRASQEELMPFKNSNILRYGNKRTSKPESDFNNPFHISKTMQYLKVRKINKIPCKVLDAPALQDDFYLNLIDWSATNQLAVGLGNCIYLWNAETSKVTKLCELQNDTVTSVSWSSDSQVLAVGCCKGEVQLWDVIEMKLIRRLCGHETRVGAMAWNSSILATGSRDKTILMRDIKARREFFNKLVQHNQEICGLKWSIDEQLLASGGNDNKVGVWSATGQLLNKFTDHRAAVKALAWSPQQHGLLATGGGTADRMMKLRNVFTGELLSEKDTGSQICNLAFSKNMHELVSTHGYSQNQINIWSYPRIKKIATLVGHSHRVLYLAMSPDGGTIVTGAGDETLRFWNIFPSSQQSGQQQCKQYKMSQGLLLR